MAHLVDLAAAEDLYLLVRLVGLAQRDKVMLVVQQPQEMDINRPVVVGLVRQADLFLVTAEQVEQVVLA
jgi:hypothetical protein